MMSRNGSRKCSPAYSSVAPASLSILFKPKALSENNQGETHQSALRRKELCYVTEKGEVKRKV